MKKLYWTIKIGVDKTWVEDGFNLSEPRQLESLLESILPYSYSPEKNIKLISKPDMAIVAKVQGYESIKEMKADYKN